jgi:hypothetical protein
MLRLTASPAGLHEAIQLVGDAADPDREADAAVQHDRQPDLLRGLGRSLHVRATG